MCLLDNQQLYQHIQDVHYNPLGLDRLVRKSIRKCLATKLQVKVKLLEIPGRLKEFLMLRIL